MAKTKLTSSAALSLRLGAFGVLFTEFTVSFTLVTQPRGCILKCVTAMNNNLAESVNPAPSHDSRHPQNYRNWACQKYQNRKINTLPVIPSALLRDGASQLIRQMQLLPFTTGH